MTQFTAAIRASPSSAVKFRLIKWLCLDVTIDAIIEAIKEGYIESSIFSVTDARAGARLSTAAAWKSACPRQTI